MILERDQVLERHTFPNWFRIASRSHRRRNAPLATVPQDIETSTVMEPPFNPADSQGILLLWFMLRLGAYFEPKGISLTHARLVVAPLGPPQEKISAQYECNLCPHRYIVPLLAYLHRSSQLTKSPSRRADKVFCKHLLRPLMNMWLKRFRCCPALIQGEGQRVEAMKSISSSAIYRQR